MHARSAPRCSSTSQASGCGPTLTAQPFSSNSNTSLPQPSSDTYCPQSTSAGAPSKRGFDEYSHARPVQSPSARSAQSEASSAIHGSSSTLHEEPPLPAEMPVPADPPAPDDPPLFADPPVPGSPASPACASPPPRRCEVLLPEHPLTATTTTKTDAIFALTRPREYRVFRMVSRSRLSRPTLDAPGFVTILSE